MLHCAHSWRGKSIFSLRILCIPHPPLLCRLLTYIPICLQSFLSGFLRIFPSILCNSLQGKGWVWENESDIYKTPRPFQVPLWKSSWGVSYYYVAYLISSTQIPPLFTHSSHDSGLRNKIKQTHTCAWLCRIYRAFSTYRTLKRTSETICDKYHNRIIPTL